MFAFYVRQSIRLERKVEVYQNIEHKTERVVTDSQGRTKKTYDVQYTQEWTDHWVD